MPEVTVAGDQVAIDSVGVELMDTIVAARSDVSAPQRQGGCVVSVRGRNVQGCEGREVAADEGISDANEKWGSRSMGNIPIEDI